MTAETQALSKGLRDIRRRVEKARRDIAKAGYSDENPPPFTKLKGAWAGANFTEAEIDAAKIKYRSLPE